MVSSKWTLSWVYVSLDVFMVMDYTYDIRNRNKGGQIPLKEKKTKVSMQDIADRLDISKNAVSLALNGKSGVSEQTRELVIQMAKRMNYTGIAHGQTGNKILVIIPDYIRYDHYFYHDVYWSIESHAKHKDYVAILSSVSDEMQSHNQVPSIFDEMDFWGIIIVGILQVSYVKYLQSLTERIVSVDQCYHKLDIDTVVTENMQGSYNITRYMIDIGHKNIGFVGSIGMTSSIYERWCGYQQAMLHAGLQINYDYCILNDSPLSGLLSDRNEIMNGLQGMDEFPTAWICGGDRIAIALIEVLGSLGYSVPEDISVVGFDNIEAGRLVTPPLTTVDVNRNYLGSSAVDILLQVSNGSHKKTKTSIYTSLIIRSSADKPSFGFVK